MSRALWQGWGAFALLGVVMLLGWAAPARADRKPLPPAEQEKVNAAIDKGVQFLRGFRVPERHKVGYTALVGLTLLECGVPADDPQVKACAAYVRNQARELDATYEIALSILFLDRLGNKNDVNYIRMLAARLIAGQTSTAGWSYKCPKPDGATQSQLLTILKQLEPLTNLDVNFLTASDRPSTPSLTTLSPGEEAPPRTGSAGSPGSNISTPGATIPGDSEAS